jgi:DNA-binding CsgD family transcriptional regulator
MTIAGAVGATRLRIAITSPDILARIRQVFAGKSMAVEFNGHPYVEITVRPARTAAPADPSAVGNAVQRLAGPVPRGGAGAHRLVAQYRLDVVDVGARPRAGQPAGRPRLALVPGPDARDPVAALSRREREVMALVSRGVRNAEIAGRLRVSEKTVKNHVNRIFRKLGAGSRVEAVLAWQRGTDDGAEESAAVTMAGGGALGAH